MKLIRWGLLKFFWRQALPATIVCTLALALLALAWPDVLTARDLGPAVIVLVHCYFLSFLFGRFNSPTFAFAYSRGYSRDVLWSHMMLASGLSVLTAWLAASLVLWTGLRSAAHDALGSPYFPIMAPHEAWLPLIWLALYVLLVPAFHYLWIRRSQPTRGRHGGSLLVGGIVVAVLVGMERMYFIRDDGWLAWLIGALYIIVVACQVLGGRTLHRSLEVRA